MKRGSPIKEQTDEWVWAVQAQHKHDTVLQGLTVLILNLIKLHKVCIFCFALLIPQILVNFQNQGLIWNLLVQTFSKDPLHVQFDQVLAEIFEVKDTWYHSFIFMIIDLTKRKTIEIWTFWVKSNWWNILDLLMVLLKIILVHIGTFDVEQNNFWNKLFRFLFFFIFSNQF